MIDINELKFNEKGLIPAAVVNYETGKLLMLAYMNRESLEKTLDTGLACFYSRSRQKLWTKGEESGNFMHVVRMVADCDRDTLKVEVRPEGPACHLGTETCFEYPLFENPEEPAPFTLDGLMELIRDRKTNPKEGSYTSYLFDKGIDKILKKVGEESTEVIIAGKGGDKAETVYEIADLCYHVMVLMCEAGISIGDIYGELAGRHVIDKKIKQEKMK